MHADQGIPAFRTGYAFEIKRLKRAVGAKTMLATFKAACVYLRAIAELGNAPLLRCCRWRLRRQHTITPCIGRCNIDTHQNDKH